MGTEKRNLLTDRRKKLLIDELREYYQLPPEFCSDEEVLKATEDSLGRARIELAIAARDLTHEIISKVVIGEE